jgi:ubiquinone/menaquinone biosynthesis C-methylase UbiE
VSIVKASTFVDAYRAKAKDSDINELSGRPGRPDITRFVAQNIVDSLNLSSNDVVVDIGCGDGSALIAASRLVCRWAGRLVGILPTDEESLRLRSHLSGKNPFVTVLRGSAERTGLPDKFADKVISNGVFIILVDEDLVNASLNEISRISKIGATVYIGEVPETDEFSGKTYGDSITRWLHFVLRNQGPAAFLQSSMTVLRSLLTSKPFVIAPKKMFWMNSLQFIAKLESYGFELVSCFRHYEIDLNGNTRECPTRFNYLVKKVR